MPKAIKDNETLDGPIEGLTPAENKAFLDGAEYFDQVFTTETGLGPIYVQSSCATCHASVGKGHPATRLIRFNKKTGSVYDPMIAFGGPQLQNSSIPGYPAETLPAGYTGVTSFIAPAVTGLGYLEAIPDATLLALADPNDINMDGISGRPNWVTAPGYFQPLSWHMPNSSGQYIGRFGRKASNLNMLMQAVNALHEDMGITTEFRPDELFNYKLGQGTGDDVPEPELASANVHALTYYLQTFKAPVPRDQDNADVIAGKGIFASLGCGSCHVQDLVTGEHPIPALSFKTVHPYTDLLMHDMGAELDDGYAEGTSESYEWRTTPLWGLGLSKISQGGKYFLMHDGRAHSIEAAIMLHGGEGSGSRTKFSELPENDKKKLIQFLESL